MRLKLYLRPEKGRYVLKKLFVLHLQFHILHELLVGRSLVCNELNILAIALKHLLDIQFPSRNHISSISSL